MPKAEEFNPQVLAELPDDALLEAVQRQTFRFFWEGAQPDCGMLVSSRSSCLLGGGSTGGRAPSFGVSLPNSGRKSC